MGRVRYRRQWEAEFPTTPGGRAAFGAIAADLEQAVAAELDAGGLLDDPPAREYLEELAHELTPTGARVFTTASRAHFVEWGTVDRPADAPMRRAAGRFGKFRQRGNP